MVRRMDKKIAPRRKSRAISIRVPQSTVDIDCEMMLRAIELARRGQGLVEPNPMVGCVIAKEGQVIGEGWHYGFGGPHAEVEAIEACKGSTNGATMYVSLEPCSHFGKTPPCADAIIKSGIARVVIPTFDPNPAVSGKGVVQLRRAGIEVSTDICGDEACELLSPFFTRVCRNRPHVIGKWAQTLNGSLITPADKDWISSPFARRWVHALRARVDAIIVGIGTVLHDDPLLTARGVPVKRVAMRVILDSALQTPPDSKIARSAVEVPTLIITANNQLITPAARTLRKCGISVISLPLSEPRAPASGLIRGEVKSSPNVRDRTAASKQLVSLLQFLYKKGATNVLVEGGPTLLRSFMAAKLLDETAVFIAPIKSGKLDGLSRRLDDEMKAAQVYACRLSRIGPDALLQMRLTPLIGPFAP